jgi:transposase
MAVDAYQDALVAIQKQIEIFTAKIVFASKEDQRVKLLMTILGIDYYFTALTIASEIVDIKRFSMPWKLVAYAGLAPSKRDSGDAHRNGGHITRQGSKWLRYIIVETANTSTRCDDRIGRFYKRIAERRGPQKARVAAAKEMLVIICYMLIKNEPYRTMNMEVVERKYKKMERELNVV